MTTIQTQVTLEKKLNNTFTSSSSTNNVTSKLFRADLCGEQQVAVVSRMNKTRRDRWVQSQAGSALLRAEDAAWAGKALLSEAIRFQYSHKSKRLTKTMLERCPLMQHNQHRYEEDVAFSMEETLRVEMIEQALRRMPNAERMSAEELKAVREKLDRQIEVPEIESYDIVAPMAPELARMMWQDFDMMLGVAAPQQQHSVWKTVALPGSTIGHHPRSPAASSSLDEVKVKYAQAVNSFASMQLWRVKHSKCKYQ